MRFLRKISSPSHIELVAEVTSPRVRLKVHSAVLKFSSDFFALFLVSGPVLSLAVVTAVVDKVAASALLVLSFAKLAEGTNSEASSRLLLHLLPDLPELLLVGLSKHPLNLGESGSESPGGTAVIVRSVLVGSIGQQNLHEVKLLCSGTVQQWSVAQSTLGVHIRSRR